MKNTFHQIQIIDFHQVKAKLRQFSDDGIVDFSIVIN